jgi:hypothetical protein
VVTPSRFTHMSPVYRLDLRLPRSILCAGAVHSPAILPVMCIGTVRVSSPQMRSEPLREPLGRQVVFG